MDKTKAVLQEKAEKVTAQHPAEKDMAEQRKEEKIREAVVNKRQAMDHNATAKEQVVPATPRASGLNAGRPPDPNRHPRRSRVSGHVTEGAFQSRPSGAETGTARPALAAHDPNVEGTEPALRGTGGRYT
ncbi:uncharacterized protein A4U43_C05F30950 [Asparagus officinalis]|uniref:Uncharacterized protein n=2 Tax=Asparagus officinalis TaxID=4686 RepID=A0A5P1EVV0_ASPOF|nr:uncharacterized protein A4U43_C05F30950 [Asparagus officinalis]